MPPRIRRAPLVVVPLLAVAMAACAGDEGAAPSGQPAMIAAPDAGLPPTVDELPGIDVDGFHDLLEAANGTPLVVNVWASWCDPCRRETPMLAEAARAHPDVQFVGIDVLDTRSGARRFLADHRVPYPSLFDVPGAVMNDLGGIGPPLTAFYAADGTQVELVRGELSPSDLERALHSIDPSP
jgi:thiol-disulfide isomerase/thioredoxin